MNIHVSETEFLKSEIKRLQKAQPAQQEPYCYTYTENGEEYFAPPKAYVPDDAKPLYTSPPAKQEPLSEEWIAHCWRKSMIGTRIHYVDYLALVRETERAHGIKEQK